MKDTNVVPTATMNKASKGRALMIIPAGSSYKGVEMKRVVITALLLDFFLAAVLPNVLSVSVYGFVRH